MALSLQLPERLRDQWRPYWRRRWLVIVSAWIFALLGWTVVALLPNKYESQARIYVETDNLLTPLLKNIAVQSDVDKQLQVLQQTLLNHDNMVTVAHVTDLDLGAHTPADLDALYTSLAKRIVLTAEGADLFTVSYTDEDPKMAQKVVDSLLNIFVETDLGQSRTSMETAQDFLDSQIADYENQLRQADQRIADFKSQHVDVLSATGSDFTGSLQGAKQLETTDNAKFQNAVVAHDELIKILAQTPQYLDISAQPQVVINNGSATAGSAQARVDQAKANLANLLSEDTAKNPDVIAAQAMLDSAEKDLQAEQAARAAGKSGGAAGSSGNVENPVYDQLKLRLAQADSDVAQAQNQVNLDKQNVAALQSLATTAPKVEADFTDLNRNYDVLKTNYNELLQRREAARISQAVQDTGDRVQFRIIDAPQVPLLPSFPNRPLFACLVFLAAIGFGGAMALLLHRVDDTVSSQAMLVNEFKVRVLGSFSRVDNIARRAERRRNSRNFATASASFVGAFAVVLTLMEFNRVPDLRATLAAHPGLSQVIERVPQFIEEKLAG